MSNEPVRVIWADVLGPVPRDYTKLDAQGTASIDGDTGGTWNPTTAIGVGGKGLRLTTAASSIRGGVKTSRGGRLRHNDNDFFTFSAARQRTVIHPCFPFVQNPGGQWQISFDYAAPISGTATGDTVTIPLHMRMHQGATLNSATLTYRVGVDLLPGSPAFWGIWRVTAAGVATSMLSTGAGYQSLGLPGTADAWYAHGAPKTNIINPDQNNVIDTTTYQYFALFADTGAIGQPKNNVLHSISLQLVNLLDMRHE